MPRTEHPTPRRYDGAAPELRITDIDGHRVTAIATNTRHGGPGTQLADLELRHRRRARAEDRIRICKDTGLPSLPLHSLDQNQIRCVVVALAAEITAWMQTLALHGHDARRWEPKRLPSLFAVPATLARTGRGTSATRDDLGRVVTPKREKQPQPDGVPPSPAGHARSGQAPARARTRSRTLPSKAELNSGLVAARW